MLGREVEFAVNIDVPDKLKKAPAIVLMHGCGGLSSNGSRAPFKWRDAFRKAGYVTLIIESFQARGWPSSICLLEREVGLAGQLDRIGEAYAAATMLRNLVFVDPQRIVVMGFSHAGGTVVLAATEYARSQWRKGGIDLRQPPYAALVANYPWCGKSDTYPTQAAKTPISTPLLIQIGENDDYTPTEFCKRMAERPAFKDNLAFHLAVLPGALHSFDSGLSVRSAKGCGGIAGACGSTISFGHSENAFRTAQELTLKFIQDLSQRQIKQ